MTSQTPEQNVTPNPWKFVVSRRKAAAMGLSEGDEFNGETVVFATDHCPPFGFAYQIEAADLQAGFGP